MNRHNQSIKLVLETKIKNIDLLSSAVRGICKSIVKDDILEYQLVLCLVEAVTNVIVHAYHQQQDKFVEVNVIIEEQTITFEVLDTGDITSLPPIKEESDLESIDIHSLPESGMGLFLIRNLMDSVWYGQNSEGKNVFKMVKNLQNQ